MNTAKPLETPELLSLKYLMNCYMKIMKKIFLFAIILSLIPFIYAEDNTDVAYKLLVKFAVNQNAYEFKTDKKYKKLLMPDWKKSRQIISQKLTILISNDETYKELLARLKSKPKNKLNSNCFYQIIYRFSKLVNDWNEDKEELLLKAMMEYANRYNEILEGGRIFPDYFSYTNSSTSKKYLDFLKEKYKEGKIRNNYILPIKIASTKIRKVELFKKTINKLINNPNDFEFLLAYPKEAEYLFFNKVKVDKNKYYKKNWRIRSTFKFKEENLDYYEMLRCLNAKTQKEIESVKKMVKDNWNILLVPLLHAVNDYHQEKINSRNDLINIIRELLKNRPYFIFDKSLCSDEQIWYKDGAFNKGLLFFAKGKRIDFIFDLPFLPIKKNDSLMIPKYYRVIMLFYDDGSNIKNFLMVNFRNNNTVNKMLKNLCEKDKIGYVIQKTVLSDKNIPNDFFRSFIVSGLRLKDLVPVPYFCPLREKPAKQLDTYHSEYNRLINNEKRRMIQIDKTYSIGFLSRKTDIDASMFAERINKFREKELEEISAYLPKIKHYLTTNKKKQIEIIDKKSLDDLVQTLKLIKNNESKWKYSVLYRERIAEIMRLIESNIQNKTQKKVKF